MLHKLFRRLKVSEVQFCLPFVQITCAVLEEDGSLPAQKRTTLAPETPALPSPLTLTVEPRPPATEVTVLPLRSDLSTILSFRIATEIDAFGPVFRTDWQPLSEGLNLQPGDFIWLRLYCRNDSERVAHNVRIAMEGIDIARKQCGILIRGVNGWPREPVGDVTVGHEVRYINPGEDYSLHCVLRAPTRLDARKRVPFSGVKPEFNILKQLL